MNKRKFVAPRMKAGGAPGRVALPVSPTAVGPELKRPTLAKPKLALVRPGGGAKAAVLDVQKSANPESRDVRIPNGPQGPSSEFQLPGPPVAAAPTGPAPAHAPASRRIFRLPAISATSMPTLESLGFDVSLPRATAVVSNLPKASVPEESLVHPAAPDAEALAAAAQALHETTLPEYLDLPQRHNAALSALLGISKLNYEPRCRVQVELMDGPAPAPVPQQPRCAPSDVTGHSIPTSLISAAIWVPTPEAEAKPGAAAAARRRLAEEAEIPLAALKAMLLC